MGQVIQQLKLLSQAAGLLATTTLDADRELQAAAVAALVHGEMPELRLLNEVQWHWRMAVVDETTERRLVWKATDRRSILRIGVDCRVSPVPRNPGPAPLASPTQVVLERPAMLLPSSAANFQRFAPGSDADAENSVLLDLGRRPRHVADSSDASDGDISDDDVLAVRHPERLLGAFKAKLWWRGQRLKPDSKGWLAQPFMAMADRLAEWLAGDAGHQELAFSLADDDALMQVVHEIVRARRVIREQFAQRSQHSEEPSILGPLKADHVLAAISAEFALRVDTLGDLADAEDAKAVELRARLTFEETLAPQEAIASATSLARLRLRPPEFLATGDVLAGLLAALQDDRRKWRRKLDVTFLQRLLDAAQSKPASGVAFRVGRSIFKERWVLFLPSPDHSAQRVVLRADFKRGPLRDDGEARIPGEVRGNRDLLHHPIEGQGGHFDNDLVRAFLRLITALKRYSQALG